MPWMALYCWMLTTGGVVLIAIYGAAKMLACLL
jgi:hypothetical protein